MAESDDKVIDEDSIDPASIRIGGRLRIQSIYYTFDNKYDTFRRKVSAHVVHQSHTCPEIRE